MNPVSHDFARLEISTISRCDRWQVRDRLQSLDIPCHCGIDDTLTAEIHHPVAALQLWSVVQPFTRDRAELIAWLKTCWRSGTP